MTKFISPCIPWEGRINQYGYGTIGVNLAHRRAWEETNGPIPEGMTIDHRCHDPEVCHRGNECPHRRCVNVAHMRLATADENRKRAYSAFALKTHCPAGHPYSAVWGGRRYCKTCRNEKLNARRRAQAVKNCKRKGHKRVEAVSKDGKRYCVECAVLKGQLAIAKLGRNKITGRIGS